MRETMRRIHVLAKSGKLPLEFTPAVINDLLRIDWAGTFLPKHSEENPGGYTIHFVRLSRGRYRLK
jgi:hypothetical protein